MGKQIGYMDITEIDFRKPLEIHCLMLEDLPTLSGSQRRVIPYKARIKWEEIEHIEQFVATWLMPNNQQDKSLIFTNKRTFIVTTSFEELAEVWEAYVLWSQKASSLFKLN